MNRWMLLGGLVVGLPLVTGSAACGIWDGQQPGTPAGQGPATHNWPTVGNPRYDNFFREVAELERLVADAQATLERARTTLNTAMNADGTTDFVTAVKNVSARLDGKVKVTIGVTLAGADVNVVAAPGVTLSAEEQTLVEAYRKAATDVAGLSMKIEPVVRASIDLGRQVAVLIASAKKDFSGKNAGPTLISVIKGLSDTTEAVGYISAHAPAITESSRTISSAIKGTTVNTAPAQGTAYASSTVPRPAYSGMPQPAYPGMPWPMYPGVPQPAYPGMPQPAYPGMPQPAYPGMPQPAYPGVLQPAYPGVPQPAYPGMPQPGPPVSASGGPAGTWESYCPLGKPARTLQHVQANGADFTIDEQAFRVRAKLSGQTATGTWSILCGPKPCASGRVDYAFDGPFQNATYRISVANNPKTLDCTLTRRQ